MSNDLNNSDQVRPASYDEHTDDALVRATQHDAEVRERNAARVEKKFNGVIDLKSGLYRIDAEPFDKDELVRWRRELKRQILTSSKT